MEHVQALCGAGDARCTSGSLSVGFCHMVWIFLICSMIGLACETLVSFALDGRWESRAGFVFGPISPIYGTGAVLMTLALNPVRGRSAFMEFGIAALIGAMFEFATGWFLEWRFGIVAWSYYNQPFNFHGHTSLAIAVVWGIAGLVWIRHVFPLIVDALELMPRNLFRTGAFVLFALIVADCVLTVGAFECWFLRTTGEEPTGWLQLFYAEHFSDAYMTQRFETMSMWPVLAER